MLHVHVLHPPPNPILFFVLVVCLGSIMSIYTANLVETDVFTTISHSIRTCISSQFGSQARHCLS